VADKWKGIMGRDGSTCHPAENYDSSFNRILFAAFYFLTILLRL